MFLASARSQFLQTQRKIRSSALLGAKSGTQINRSSSSAADDIPVPSGDYPFVGHLSRLIQDGNAPDTWSKMHKECGEIVRAKLPGNKSYVITSNPSHSKEVLSNQGRYPYRINQKAWEAIFDEKGWPQGIPIAKGDEWKRRRKVLAETLLSSKSAKQYLPVVVPAANNFVNCLEGHLDPEGRLLPSVSIRQLAGLFALEAVMKVVVGVDFPACTVPINDRASSFAKAVEDMFAYSRPCENMPWNITFKLKPYQKLKAAWEELYNYPQEQLNPVFKYYQEHGELPKESQSTILPKLIEQYEAGDLSLDEVVGIGIQAIVAAVDTTGQTTEYFLYNLAKNPDIQERLAADFTSAFGTEGPLDISSISDFDKQSYLFAALKESMRLTPTVGVHVRTLVQDAQLGSFKVEKDEAVMINYQAMTQDDKIFPEPDLFLPERFLKQPKGDGEQVSAMQGCPMTSKRRAEAIDDGKAVCNHPYAAIPFGHGGRKCVGKGFAEMDIHLAIISLLRRFKVSYNGPELECAEKTLLRPKQPIHPHFKFERRV